MFKRHYIDGIEYPPSPICGEKPKFESNVTSFQFRQNASAFWRGKNLPSSAANNKKLQMSKIKCFSMIINDINFSLI